MIVASISMLKPIQDKETDNQINSSYLAIFGQGLFIGFIAGFVGAGGGFLIIPALIYMANTPMKIAVGTSLFIISSQSLFGFLGDIVATLLTIPFNCGFFFKAGVRVKLT